MVGQYVKFIANSLGKILTIDGSYLVLILVLFFLFHILCSFAIDQIFKEMKIESNIILWIPFLNIYYIGHKVHSLYGMIMIIQTLLLLAIPYKINGVWVISRICSSFISNILMISLIIEIPVEILIILLKYLKYENRIRVVK